jgi:hypothetical protein
MFDKVMSLFFGLSYETQILEACDWNEERAKELSDLFSNALNAAKISDLSKSNDAIENIEKDLMEFTTMKEREALMEILYSSLKNMSHLVDSSDKYEN